MSAKSGHDPAVKRTRSGSSWESEAGYCRAVRVDDQIFVSGTTALSGGEAAAPEDMAGQARRCFEHVAEALRELDAGVQHVVRTRMFVTDISQVGELSEVHREFFGAHPPASTLIEVTRLVRPDILIEVEVDAIVQEHANL